MNDDTRASAQLAGNSASPVNPMTPRFLEIHRVTRETSDTATLVLADDARPPFAPGQFNMLYVLGAGEVAVSMSGDPADAGLLVHTVRAVGAVTNPLVSMKRGASLGVRGPFGSGWPVEEAARRGSTMLLLAGGIGLAPLRPVVYYFLRNRSTLTRLLLLYGTRTPRDLLYKRELERWGRDAAIDLHIIVDRGDSSWRGRVGVLTDLLDSCKFEPPETIAMVCGPEVMMRMAARALTDRGVAESDIHLAMERNMKCAIGTCGHCQFGPSFVCKEGPVLPLSRIAPILGIREV